MFSYNFRQNFFVLTDAHSIEMPFQFLNFLVWFLKFYLSFFVSNLVPNFNIERDEQKFN